MDMLEQIIQLVTMLFLLSMVCERIADFFKHYLCGSKFFGIGDTVTKTPGDDIKEQARAYRILKINVWCGVLISAILKADLIKIFNNIGDPGKTIGWNNINSYNALDFFLIVPGIFLTGCFISFGSKFWHDLLDILYQTKNVKRLLADPETRKIDNINTLSESYNIYPSDFIQPAYFSAKQDLLANPNVKAVSLKYGNRGYYFEVSVKKYPDNSVPVTFNYQPSKGGPVSIPVTIIALNEDDIIPHVLNIGSRIANDASIVNWGTLGCMVTKNSDTSKRKYILTCYHNVVEPGSKFQFQVGTIDTTSPDAPSTNIGSVEFAIRDHEADAALISIDENNSIENDLPEDRGHPVKVRKLINADIEKNVFISMYGAKSKSKWGTVKSIYTDVKIKYSDKEHTLLNLICISQNGKAISAPGDSGACIMDENNNLIGILVAGSKTTSYALPAASLFTKLDISLIQP